MIGKTRRDERKILCYVTDMAVDEAMKPGALSPTCADEGDTNATSFHERRVEHLSVCRFESPGHQGLLGVVYAPFYEKQVLFPFRVCLLF